MDNKMPPLKDAAPSGAFMGSIATLKNGLLIAEIDDALREVTEAVSRTQLKGSVTVTLKISPGGVGFGDVPLFSVTPHVVPDKPKAKEKSQTFFADEHFNLMRRNPNQMEAPALTVVSDLPATGAGVDRSHRAKAAASS